MTKRSKWLFASLLILGMATASLAVIPSNSRYSPSPGDAVAKLTPLWVDDDTPEPADSIEPYDDRPPWPRNLSSEQWYDLARARVVIAATIDPYRSAANVSFHGYTVLGAREFAEPDDVRQIVRRLVDCTRALPGLSPEFYPFFALRVICDHERDQTDHVVDFIVSPEAHGFYVITPDEKRFCTADTEQCRDLFEDLTAGLPMWEYSPR